MTPWVPNAISAIMRGTSLKKRVYQILELAQPGDKFSRAFDIFIISIILLNIFAVILGSIQTLAIKYSGFFRIFEVISIVIFTLEYILRLWTATENQRYKKPFVGRIIFALTPLALVDIIAVIPFYLPMLIPIDLRFIRALRLLRLLRLLKIGRYSDSLRLFGRVIKSKKEELLITTFAIFILLTISSSLLYYVESGAQPDKFSSIPEAMWWGVATLTTVGYGDVYPITALGKLLGAIISLLGIGLFAMPAGILSAGFIEQINARKSEEKKCPHCGGIIDTPIK